MSKCYKRQLLQNLLQIKWKTCCLPLTSVKTQNQTPLYWQGLQLLASGTGQTSRVDALRQAIKNETFGFDLDRAVMESDAFFHFPTV